ncbi:hypothetical protein ACOT81_27425 [Streptomyces sp. WI04-05B]|uniref:hypothetical protein n=1 Tax=Streptomyces TaxID=1883 RepID=UPI0029B0C582|nr:MULTISPECIES: hypothetical protein [unclassified Streptomyces]MDX2546161.1 hypothetical protein [Streptomyces sp. WI04-05B]MDX2587149.1 hypothetical protein [Streptomyces sp. WI04-05A]MDX3750686.1 hypothetical protein [Streptomyces sp. AK08-02]
MPGETTPQYDCQPQTERVVLVQERDEPQAFAFPGSDLDGDVDGVQVYGGRGVEEDSPA